MSIKQLLQRGRTWLVIMLLMVVGSMTGYAQSECFDYEDDGKTIITGLTNTGLAAYSLTIPATVTTVKSGAFSSTSAKATELIIENGGNPTFEASLFGERANPLSEINILGSSMTVANITALLTSLGSQGELETVFIEGYSGEWSDIEETNVLASDVEVRLPAALVTDQQFGDARVYGRFTLEKDLVTFCGSATFLDESESSDMLFYVADAYNKDEGYIHIQRVHYVAEGQGVLIHNATNTSNSVDLPRVSDGSVPSSEQTLYGKNMLKGVTEATTIGKTENGNTNLVLSNGAFHPTSGGTIGANKAYLQVPTSSLSREMLTISFDEEATEIKTTNYTNFTNCNVWFDLQGRKLDAEPTMKGLYINNGKKYVIR